MNHIPQNVLDALDRMCTPLDETRLSGATAKEDARCMQVIKDFIMSKGQPAPSGQYPGDELVEQWFYEWNSDEDSLEAFTVPLERFIARKACDWQRERDAQIAEAFITAEHGPYFQNPARLAADAIRAQGGGV